jgi:hypothetical protein
MAFMRAQGADIVVPDEQHRLRTAMLLLPG